MLIYGVLRLITIDFHIVELGFCLRSFPIGELFYMDRELSSF